MNPCAAVEPPERAEHKRSELSGADGVYNYGDCGEADPVTNNHISHDRGQGREVCGLKWPDIDFKGMTIHIHQAIKGTGEACTGDHEEQTEPLCAIDAGSQENSGVAQTAAGES